MQYPTPYGVIDLPFPQGTKGISCSGGADSSIVLAAMVANGTVPRVFFIDNANSSLKATQAVVDYLNAKYNVNLFIEVVQRTTEGNFIRPDIINLGTMVDFLYTGVTQNPPVHISDTGIPNRPAQNTTTKFITPFLTLDKRASLFLYGLLGVEDMLALTYTCTQNPIAPCQDCFACREKNWALAEIASDASKQ